MTEEKLSWVTETRLWDPETKEYISKDEPPKFDSTAVVRFFVISDDKKYELAPVFHSQATAKEIARHSNTGEPFFDRIPAVMYGAAYPRTVGSDIKLGVSKRRQLRDVRQS